MLHAKSGFERSRGRWLCRNRCRAQDRKLQLGIGYEILYQRF